jgi:hypothetical protein
MKNSKYITLRITQMFEACLDYAQVACPESQYKQLRSKILREGNNCLRDVQKFLEESNASKENQ